MKYIIDVEKIEGTNLWKAKEFNTLVFDRNGLNKLYILDEDTQEKEIKGLNHKLGNEMFHVERLKYLVNEQSAKIDKLKDELADYKCESEVIEDLRRESKRLSKKVRRKQGVIDFLKVNMEIQDMLIDKLQKEKAELLEKIASLENKLPCEEKVPVEVPSENLRICDRDIKRMNHTIKTQKGIIKKQGKEISKLQKQNEKLKNSISFWKSVIVE